MSMRIMRSKALPIGIDLGTHSLKMAQLRSLPGGQYELVATGFAELPAESRKSAGSRARFVAGAIKRILKSQPFKGRQCTLSLPAATTFVQAWAVCERL